MQPESNSEEYWSDRYRAHDTPWDVGGATRPLRAYADQLRDKSIRILIPGAGNAYEAEYLHQQGFTNVHVADISTLPLRTLKDRCPSFPDDHLLHADFFELGGQYDLILEQTFFCALSPDLRGAYIRKCLDLLIPGGSLVGVLFDDPLFTDHPPYGGNLEEYENLFLPAFERHTLERCYNSIKPRQGREIFIHVRKPGPKAAAL